EYKYWLDRVVAPVLILASAEHVARPGKRRHPFAADEFGVPADMVDMQMRAQHDVDGIRRKARGGELFQERIVAVVPGRHVAALLVVAEPGVDHDTMLRRLHDQGVDRHFQPALL